MDSTWLFSAAVALLMIAQAQLARHQLGSWLAPGALFCLVWTTATVSCLLIAPEYRIWPGILWIFFMTCTAHLGGILAAAGSPDLTQPEAPEPISQPLEFPLLLPILCVSAVSGIVGELYLLSTVGRDFSTLFSLHQISDVSAYFTGARYTDATYHEPNGFLVSQILVYFTGYLGGVVFGLTRTRSRRAIAVTSITPAVVSTVLIGARSIVVGFGMCWLAAYCAVRAYAGDKAPWRSGARAFGAMGLAMLAFTGFFVATQAVRMGTFGTSAIGWAATRERTVAYSLTSAKNEYVGYIASFSDWFSENWDVWETPGLGVNSFAGPAAWLGLNDAGQSVEPIQVSADSEATQTNVFSMFRQMALDWTLPGSAVFLLIMSFLASIAYARVRAGSVACIPFLALFDFIALYVTGFALHTTLADAAWLMFALYVWAVCSRKPVEVA